MNLLIKNGHIVDPENNIDGVFDILVDGHRIFKVDKEINSNVQEIIDASGKIVIPGLVDMHVHLREPGREDKETILSGTTAAAKGGVTSILAMPNTIPALDSPENLALLKAKIKESAKVNVFICAAITEGRRGKELTNFLSLKEHGAVALSDDGSSVDDADLVLEAFRKAKEAGIILSCHCEDKTLSNNGAVNLGFISTKLGLRGISRESEYKRIERDIKLAVKLSCPLHIAHISCLESVEVIAEAKRKGYKVTCETAPHYFTLTEEAVAGYDTNMKMNPPLRRENDLLAIKKALREGIIDAIASDHAPHTENDKEIEFDRAEFGVIGLETELSVAITELIESKVLDWKSLVEKMSLNPARILGLKKGSLSEGADADIVILDPDKEWVVEKSGFLSKSKNSCFLGKKLKGVVEYTICSGNIVYRNTVA
jgi:dihydroorotase